MFLARFPLFKKPLEYLSGVFNKFGAEVAKSYI